MGSEGDDGVDSAGILDPNDVVNVYRICVERVDTERTDADGEYGTNGDHGNNKNVIDGVEHLILNEGLVGYTLPSYPDIPRSQIVYGNNNGDNDNEDNSH